MNTWGGYFLWGGGVFYLLLKVNRFFLETVWFPVVLI